jgi:hypothetical protein
MLASFDGESTMQTIADTEISNRFMERGETIADLTATGCAFRNCSVSVFPPASTSSAGFQRVTLRNCEARDCSVLGANFGPAIIDTCSVVNLKTIHEPMFFRGTAFRHCTLSGKIGNLCLRPEPTTMPNAQLEQEVASANALFYRDVDWALDISQAIAAGLYISSIPVDLVRYDPSTQGIVRLSTIEDRWDELLAICGRNAFAYCLSDLRQNPLNDGVVLCVPLQAPKAKREVLETALQELKKARICD